MIVLRSRIGGITRKGWKGRRGRKGRGDMKARRGRKDRREGGEGREANKDEWLLAIKINFEVLFKQYMGPVAQMV